ncbi:MAG: hypothetical protein ACYC0T_07535 [Ramlibacter sp.]
MSDSEVHSKPEQISLPFTSRPKLFAVLTGHIRGPEEFGRLADALSVSLILDMRTAPRLDIVAPTRLQAFNYFESRSIQYRDVLGRVGVNSYTSLDLQAVGSEVLASFRAGDPSPSGVLMLFESPAFRDICTELLDREVELDRMDAAQVDFFASEERLRM